MLALARHHLGLRRQVGLVAKRPVLDVVPNSDAAFLPGANSLPSVSRHPKAPSSLRFAGAVQNLAGRLKVHGEGAGASELEGLSHPHPFLAAARSRAEMPFLTAAVSLMSGAFCGRNPDDQARKTVV